jgi:hypothetical protein
MRASTACAPISRTLEATERDEPLLVDLAHEAATLPAVRVQLAQEWDDQVDGRFDDFLAQRRYAQLGRLRTRLGTVCQAGAGSLARDRSLKAK